MKRRYPVNNTMTGLIERLKLGNQHIYLQNTNGEVEAYTCSINSPATQDNINYLLDQINMNVPIEYIDFLKYCNGCSLFNHHLYGGENLIYSCDEVVNFYHSLNAEGCLPIAYILQENIVIDCDAFNQGKEEYMYVKINSSFFDEGINLHCNFETWLYRFIITNGNKYWNWL
ncbi:SMI1/KNR4 family protein [Paenibacillus sp. P26]|nr:SMI1/KNR4 family protein [Paenibacillus sp. P26]UUZ92665.1 SMI1/KNR4 family protein [Paenibacillus sp. P25]